MKEGAHIFSKLLVIAFLSASSKQSWAINPGKIIKACQEAVSKLLKPNPIKLAKKIGLLEKHDDITGSSNRMKVPTLHERFEMSQRVSDQILKAPNGVSIEVLEQILSEMTLLLKTEGLEIPIHPTQQGFIDSGFKHVNQIQFKDLPFVPIANPRDGQDVLNQLQLIPIPHGKSTEIIVRQNYKLGHPIDGRLYYNWSDVDLPFEPIRGEFYPIVLKKNSKAIDTHVLQYIGEDDFRLIPKNKEETAKELYKINRINYEKRLRNFAENLEKSTLAPDLFLKYAQKFALAESTDLASKAAEARRTYDITNSTLIVANDSLLRSAPNMLWNILSDAKRAPNTNDMNYWVHPNSDGSLHIMTRQLRSLKPQEAIASIAPNLDHYTFEVLNFRPYTAESRLGLALPMLGEFILRRK